ncbi:MAG: hypothetical protein OXC12_10285 [Spirochaetaceae bacterium]|nr:hypothetical protein [Spirochaetaceae bacterium]
MTGTTTAVEAARQPHHGVFITAPGQVELRRDRLPERWFAGGYVITESLGNSVCSSDQKAVQQFTSHARIPGDATAVALGHETVHRVVAARPGTAVRPGQVVLITPGLSSTPVDPESFAPAPDNGVLAALGYSFRYAAGMRRYSGLPERVAEVVAEQGMGELFIPIPPAVGADPATSLATLAHAEPFACCRGALRQMFTRGAGGELVAGVPPDASVAMLSGTGRMAMITLAILARGPGRPSRIAVTGSARRLRQLGGTPMVAALRGHGVTVDLVDRGDPEALSRLRSGGRFDVVITFFASQESYDLAATLVRDGGNVNNFAGASDPDIVLPMTIPAVAAASAGDVRAALNEMIHPEALGAERRVRGLASPARVALTGFGSNDVRLDSLLRALPPGTAVAGSGTEAAGAGPDLADRFPELAFGAAPPYTDLFIADRGEAAARTYREYEPQLARDAAVNFLDGGTQIGIRSRHVHYLSRHQVCGPTVPYYLTNTSEPASADLAEHARDPIGFDWMVRRIAGLAAAPELIRDVGRRTPFGSHFVLTQLEDLPYVEVGAEPFRAAAATERQAGRTGAAAALIAAADVLAATGDQWSRAVEDSLYGAFGLPHPLAE